MISVGDKVKITDWYLASYPKWGAKIKDKEATVVAVSTKTVAAKNLDKDTKPIYRAMYGDLQQYDLYSLLIKFDNDTYTYLVSQLGFNKV